MHWPKPDLSWDCSLRETFLLMQDSCQTDCNLVGQISTCRTEGIFVVRILFSLLRFTGHFSDRLNVFAGQNEKMPVLSGSPALFVKTGIVKHQVLQIYNRVIAIGYCLNFSLAHYLVKEFIEFDQILHMH